MRLSPTCLCVIFALAVVPVEQAWSQSEACCLPNDTCINADPNNCSTQSGTSIVGACFDELSTCCFPGGTCAALDGNCCRLEGGTILPGQACDTRPCCSANDTANACEIRDVCSCVAAAGTPAQSGGTCPDCCAVQSGSLSEPSLLFNNEADLCAAFHGFPIFPDLIPPMAPDNVYAGKLARFLRNGQYRQLGWLRDLRIRPFGNYQGVPPDDNGSNAHSHPGLRLYYSPEIIEWLCNSRQGRCISSGSLCTTNGDCPSGDTCELLKPQAMIVAEIRPYTSINKDPDMRCREGHTVCTTNADCPVGDECLDNIMWLNDSCYDDAPSSWAVMASGLPNGILPGAPPDNWFWLEEDSVGAEFGYNMSSCIGCHASAPGTSTFANLRNILDEEILYQHIAEFCGDGVVNDAPNEECDDGNLDAGDCCSPTCSFETGACDDGNPCTIDDQCQMGICQGNPNTCGDGTVQSSCGEECEFDLDCGPVEVCDSSCSCGSVSRDHYQCYKAKERKRVCQDDLTAKCKTNADCSTLCLQKFVSRTVSLTDQFGSSSPEVKKPKSLCAPVEKIPQGPSPQDFALHYKRYQIKGVPSVKGLRVLARDQFGDHVIELTKEDSLLVPAAKDPNNPVEALAPGANHYLCYKAKNKKKICTDDLTTKCKTDAFCTGGGVCDLGFGKVPQQLMDQFGTSTPEIKKVKFFCTPVDKDSGGIADASNHLIGYQIKGPGIDATVHTNDQFGPEALALSKQEILFVPAEKNPTP